MFKPEENLDLAIKQGRTLIDTLIRIWKGFIKCQEANKAADFIRQFNFSLQELAPGEKEDTICNLLARGKAQMGDEMYTIVVSGTGQKENFEPKKLQLMYKAYGPNTGFMVESILSRKYFPLPRAGLNLTDYPDLRDRIKDAVCK